MNASRPSAAAPWAVVTVHARKDAYAIEHLERQKFVVYQPRILKRVRQGKKLVDLPRPLFPSYLFVEMERDPARWRSLSATLGVRRVIQFGERPASLSAVFVEALKAREQAGIIIRPVEPLVVGDNVRVTRGPFEGAVARIIDATESDRVVILLQLLQRDVSAAMHVGAVEKM